jgi:hypothetical protein
VALLHDYVARCMKRGALKYQPEATAEERLAAQAAILLLSFLLRYQKQPSSSSSSA